MSMYRITLLFCFLLCFDVQGQSCLPAYTTFTRQEQIDSFSIVYPGCTEIEGSLVLSGPNIKNFNGLLQLRHIQGELNIYNTMAVNVAGLDSILSVGSLLITGNYHLENFNALHQIENLDRLTISGNVITDYSGLSSLKVANTILLSGILNTDLSFLPPTLSFKSIELNYLTELQSLYGLPHGDNFLEGIEKIKLKYNNNLTDISALLGIRKLNTLEISSNNRLTSLTGLDSLEVINSIDLLFNNKLTSITALYHVKEIQELQIRENPSLLNLHGLDSITSIGFISIWNNSALPSLEGLNQLRVVERNAVFENGNFEDLTGLGLDSVYGYIRLTDNYHLTNLNGLQSLKYVGGQLIISENPELIALTHLDSLNYVNSVSILSNPKLEDLHGFEVIHTIHDGFFIQDNSSLINLNGLNMLDSVKGIFSVKENPVLTDLSAMYQIDYVGDLNFTSNATLQHLPVFENLQYIPGSVNFSRNPALQSIYGLRNLRTLNRSVLIYENPQLTSLNGLDSVDEKSVLNVYLIGNPILSTCENTFICKFIEYHGWLTVMNNAIGCNSMAEIEAQCGTLANSELEEIGISIYPNPTSGSIFLIAEQIINSITLLDASGIALLNIDNPSNEIDLSPYPAGIYFMQIQMDAGVIMKKLIKN